MPPTILILGATGTVGRPLVDLLLQQGAHVRAASRDPVAAAAFDPRPRWVSFDFERPETFDPVLDGVDAVFLISRPGDEAAHRFAAPFIAAMTFFDVNHVVHLSAMGTEERPDFSLRKVELRLEASGIPFTHLRPNFFMQVYTTGSLGAAIAATGQIALPAAGAKLSLIDAHDVAACAAAVFGDTASHAGRSYTLTGPRAVDHDEIAQHLSEASGRPVHYVPINDEAMRSVLRKVGFPEDRIARLLEMYRLVRHGACEPVHPDAESLLGRRATDFADSAARMMEEGAGVTRGAE